MTQKQKKELDYWLEERFPTLTSNDRYLIVMHVDHYFSPTETKPFYDDDIPGSITGTEDGI